MENPLVSIVITTKNSARTLNALLVSIKNQTYQKIEIIVVDNNSNDQTVEIAKKFTKKIYQQGPERSAQRNFGASKARGALLFFLDSDMVLGQDIVKECVNKLKNYSRSKIGGLIIPEKSFGQGFWTKAKILEREISEGEEYFEASRFFPKDVFNILRGYDESLTGPEDWEFHQRVSKIYSIERIKSYIRHDEGSQTLFGLARKKYYYGLSLNKYLDTQNISLMGPRTIYFLRPVFYKKWRRLLKSPLQTIGMIIMLMAETIGGGLGYLRGLSK